ncbi:MAG TPA: 2-hydroxychromene-2-carboxylate isomerase [Paracoccaceae bacterium]|nr:2-hydroxychromene-2-carboxylate isomerase [Paracoccaceae bacterium]HMO73078.1 2-hydroxychromene-2-carboxylate isomerase [Paracoccaceae bacterium]
MAQIDYFLATVSPYTYLAGLRLEDIAARHGATIAYKPVDVLALFDRTGGIRPAQRHENRKAYRLQELRRQSAKTGLKLNIQPAFWPANPAPSSYAIISAARTGADVGPLVHAFCRACWAEERNIADDETVRAILAENGFDPGLADRGMLAAAETYARNLDEAVDRGAFGAPFYIVGDERFWGQDRLDDLEMHLAGKL